MKYEGFQQLIATMEAAGYDYKAEIALIEQKKQALSVGAAKAFPLSEHIRTMVYAQLSNNRPWERIADNMEHLDVIFCHFDPDALKAKEAARLTEEVEGLSCGNRQIQKQMQALKSNIETLERIARDHGSIDAYYQKTDLVTVIKSLSDFDGKYKLVTMGVPLVCEYLKGLGLEVVKPDTLLCRLLGRLGYSPKIPATNWEAIRICQDIGAETGLSQTEVDTILWQYCAKKKFEVCTAQPKCHLCGVTHCKYRA